MAAASLWAPGFGFDSQGAPVVRIGLADGLRTAEFEVGGRRCMATPNGGGAHVRRVVGVESLSPDAAKVEAALAVWRIRGHEDAVAVRRGALYSFGGGVVDTRRVWIGVGGDGERGARPALEVVLAPPTGVVSLSCAQAPAQAFSMEGAAFRGIRYPGVLVVALDRTGALTVMNQVDAETALQAVVPAETFPSAPPAALQAQAVAARTQLLARLGARHTADPFHLCDDTHCQVYAPRKATPTTSAAVAATRGEVVSHGTALVDTVYSASCGGFPVDAAEAFGAGRRGTAPLQSGQERAPGPDLMAPPRPWCGRTTYGKERYRWVRALRDAARGAVVLERGPSGRVSAVRLADGSVVRGQLRVRRALGDLPSALFTLVDGHAHGGGHGHGAGMCQIGAIGQAEADRSRAEILRSYYGEDVEIRRLW